MGKVAPDGMIDSALNWVAGSANYYTVCSGSPSDYTTARATNCLAGIGITSGCFTKSDYGGAGGGRRLDITAKTSASITVSGSALAVCLLDTTNSRLLYVTTCTEQYLVQGGTVDIPTWMINIQDPT
jgi:hypothetical protein